RVQRRDHALELAQRAGRRIAQLGREKADAVVAPVVAQAVLQKMALVDEGVDREQLHRGDAELLQVFYRRRRGEAGVGAAELLRDFGMALREAFDVELIDQRVLPGCARRAVLAPAERGVD